MQSISLIIESNYLLDEPDQVKQIIRNQFS